MNRGVHPVDKSHPLWVKCTRPSHWLRHQWRQDPSEHHDITNVYHSNIKNLAASACEWDRNRFEIYGSALECNSIFHVQGLNHGCIDSVYIKGNQVNLFQYDLAYFNCRVYYTNTINYVNWSQFMLCIKVHYTAQSTVCNARWVINAVKTILW